MSHAVGGDTTFFGWLGANPHQSESFNNLMVGSATGENSALEVYPTKERLLHNFEGGVLLVDVGGSVGQGLERFQQYCLIPADAELVLQDLENVVSTAKVEKPIIAMSHDFFTPQPIYDQSISKVSLSRFG